MNAAPLFRRLPQWRCTAQTSPRRAVSRLLPALICLAAALVLTLTACAPRPRSVALPAPPSGPLEVHFGALARLQGREVPLQGALQMAPQGGILVLILPQGRTVGQCRYTAPATPENTLRTTALSCTPALRDDAVAPLLMAVGVACGRFLPALAPDTAPAPLDGPDWRVRWAADAMSGGPLHGRYEDKELILDLNVTEVLQP